MKRHLATEHLEPPPITGTPEEPNPTVPPDQPDVEPQFDCDLCDRKLKTLTALVAHKKVSLYMNISSLTSEHCM